MEFVHSVASIRPDDVNLDFDKLVSTEALTALFPEFSTEEMTLRLHRVVFDTVVVFSEAPKHTHRLYTYTVSNPAPDGLWATI